MNRVLKADTIQEKFKIMEIKKLKNWTRVLDKMKAGLPQYARTSPTLPKKQIPQWPWNGILPQPENNCFFLGGVWTFRS